MCNFFPCWFLKRHPWNKTALLNLWVPALTWQRFTYDCTRASRAVEKENGRYSSRKSNCMACCFEKAKTSVAIKGRYKVIPCTTLICTKAAAIRPAISYFELFKSSSLKRGMEASPAFFCVVWHGRSILSWWTVEFQLKSNSWNVYIHFPQDWWRDISTRHMLQCEKP